MASPVKAQGWRLLGYFKNCAEDVLDAAEDLLDQHNVVRMNSMRQGIDRVNAFLALRLPPVEPQDAPEEEPVDAEEEPADADPPEEQAADAEDPPEEEQAADIPEEEQAEDLPEEQAEEDIPDPFNVDLFLESMDGLYNHFGHVQQILETVNDEVTIIRTVRILQDALFDLNFI